MPTVFGYHEVKDTGHWLASPKRQDLLGPLGVTNVRTFVDPERPTRVGVLMDVPDMEALGSGDAERRRGGGDGLRRRPARELGDPGRALFARCCGEKDFPRLRCS